MTGEELAGVLVKTKAWDQSCQLLIKPGWATVTRRLQAFGGRIGTTDDAIFSKGLFEEGLGDFVCSDSSEVDE